jgi:hypothetical protein
LLTATLLQLHSGVDCPSAEAVSRRLAALLPVAAAQRSDRVLIDVVGGRMEIELSSPTLAAAEVRSVDAVGSCEDMAGVAAVVVATWEAELHGAEPTPPVAAPTIQRPLRRPLRWEIAAAFVASVSGGGFAPGAQAKLVVALPRGVVAVAGVEGAGYRALALDPGRVDWTRAALDLGAGYRYRRGRFVLDGNAELLLGLVAVTGRGYSQSSTAFSFDTGVGAGVRLGMVAGRLVPFIGFAAAGWLRPIQAHVEGVAQTVSLPRWELQPVAGLAFTP